MNELAKLARRIAKHRDQWKEISADAERLARQAVDDGMSEVKLADLLDVNRLTVRRWLGK